MEICGVAADTDCKLGVKANEATVGTSIDRLGSPREAEGSATEVEGSVKDIEAVGICGASKDVAGRLMLGVDIESSGVAAETDGNMGAVGSETVLSMEDNDMEGNSRLAVGSVGCGSVGINDGDSVSSDCSDGRAA